MLSDDELHALATSARLGGTARNWIVSSTARNRNRRRIKKASQNQSAISWGRAHGADTTGTMPAQRGRDPNPVAPAAAAHRARRQRHRRAAPRSGIGCRPGGPVGVMDISLTPPTIVDS